MSNSNNNNSTINNVSTAANATTLTANANYTNSTSNTNNKLSSEFLSDIYIPIQCSMIQPIVTTNNTTTTTTANFNNNNNNNLSYTLSIPTSYILQYAATEIMKRHIIHHISHSNTELSPFIQYYQSNINITQQNHSSNSANKVQYCSCIKCHSIPIPTCLYSKQRSKIYENDILIIKCKDNINNSVTPNNNGSNINNSMPVTIITPQINNVKYELRFAQETTKFCHYSYLQNVTSDIMKYTINTLNTSLPAILFDTNNSNDNTNSNEEEEEDMYTKSTQIMKVLINIYYKLL